jgi:hypothetical protein
VESPHEKGECVRDDDERRVEKERVSTALTKASVSTAANAVARAYERPSLPSQVTRGRIVKRSPAMTPARRPVSRVARTVTKKAATPTPMALGNRSVKGE